MAEIYAKANNFKVPPRLGAAPQPADSALLDALAAFDAADVSDVVGPLYTMDPSIVPLHAGNVRFVGEAVTVKSVPGDNKAVLGALGHVRARSVLVVDARGFMGTCGSGSKVLATPVEDGLAGVVIDGAWRDAEEVKALGLPLFGKGKSIASPAKAHLGEINVPVSCGGVVVEPGDILVGDAEGVAVIPRRHLAEVVAALTGKTAGDDSSAALRGRAEARAVQFAKEFTAANGVSDKA